MIFSLGATIIFTQRFILQQEAISHRAGKCVKILGKAGAKGVEQVVCELAKDDKNLEMLEDVLGLDYLSQQPPTGDQIETASKEWQQKTPLDYAIAAEAMECAILLCKAGAKDRYKLVGELAKNDNNCEKLIEALDLGILSSPALHPPTEAQIEAVSKKLKGKTPLEWAIDNEAMEFAVLLCQAGAEDRQRLVCKLASSDNNYEKLAEVLGIDPSSKQPSTEAQIEAASKEWEGLTPLDWAILGGAGNCALLLCQAGARGADMIFELAQDDKHCTKLAELLGVDPLSEKPPTEAQIEAANRKWYGRTPLEFAARAGATECAKVICKAGAKDANTFLLFNLAEDDANSDELAELLEVHPSTFDKPPTKAQIEAANKKWLGKTLLQHAARHGASKCAKIICKAGAEEANAYLIFELAGDDAHSDKLAELLGVDLSNTSQPPTEAQIEEATRKWDAGVSLFHHAAQKGATECVKILGMAGAAQSDNDKFLLSYAIRGKVISILFPQVIISLFHDGICYREMLSLV